MTATAFYELVTDRFGHLCKTYGLRMPLEKGFILRLDATEVFVTVVYDACRSHEVLVSIGMQKSLMHSVERPFQLAELLRITGGYDLPEVKDEIVAGCEDIGQTLSRLAELLARYGDQALRGDRNVFGRLDAQRDLDCMRYQHDRPLLTASRDACEAWSKGRYKVVVSLLSSFRERLTPSERTMLEAAEARAREE